METDVRQIGTKASAHLCGYIFRKRLTATAAALDSLLGIIIEGAARTAHDGGASNAPGRRPVNLRSRGVAMLSDPAPNTTNNLVGDGIGLVFGWVVCRSDGKLQLDHRSGRSFTMRDEFCRYGLRRTGCLGLLFFAPLGPRHSDPCHRGRE